MDSAGQHAPGAQSMCKNCGLTRWRTRIAVLLRAKPALSVERHSPDANLDPVKHTDGMLGQQGLRMLSLCAEWAIDHDGQYAEAAAPWACTLGRST